MDLHDILFGLDGHVEGSAGATADVLLRGRLAKDAVDPCDLFHGAVCIQVLLVVATDQIVVPLDIDKHVEDVRLRCLGVEHRSIVSEPCKSLFGGGRVDVLKATSKPFMDQWRTSATWCVGLCVETVNAPELDLLQNGLATKLLIACTHAVVDDAVDLVSFGNSVDQDLLSHRIVLWIFHIRNCQDETALGIHGHFDALADLDPYAVYRHVQEDCQCISLQPSDGHRSRLPELAAIPFW